MHPSIILDKSTLQSLNSEEISTLSEYFSINIPPVLLIEILGDLAKNMDTEDTRRKVQILANKIDVIGSTVNCFYKNLVCDDLFGNKVNMSGRIIIDGGISFVTSSGKKAIFVDESSEVQALRRWREGQFQEAEYVLASRWRETLQDINMDRMKNHLRKSYPHLIGIKSNEELRESIESIVYRKDNQIVSLRWVINEMQLSKRKKDKVLTRWRKFPIKVFLHFAPYAFYFYLNNIVFNVGLLNGMITTKRTNKIDLQYFYYMPFCRVFSSNDKFHEVMVDIFSQDKLFYVQGISLKNDLNKINQYWVAAGPEAKKRWVDENGLIPPPLENSPIRNIYDDLIANEGMHPQRSLNLSEEGGKNLVEYLLKEMEPIEKIISK